MSNSTERVRELTVAMGLSIPENRLEQLAQAWKQALAETESVRQHPIPWPAPSTYDAAWSKKR